MDFVDDCILDSEEHVLSTQFLQMQKNHLIDSQEHFERYCNVLPNFGFNSAKYGPIVVKFHLLPILVNKQDIELTVTKKANQIVSLKIGDIQLLDFMNFLGGTRRLPSLFKAKKTNETEGLLPLWMVQKNWATRNFLRMTFFLKICAIVTLLKKITTILKILFRGDYQGVQALAKLGMGNVHPTGAQNTVYLQNLRDNGKLQPFAGFVK